jgi:hypothetical protein
MNRIDIIICIITFFYIFFLHLASCPYIVISHHESSRLGQALGGPVPAVAAHLPTATSTPHHCPANSKTQPPIMSTPNPKSAWLFFAVTSGACAAFNGVFAKLYVPTTSQMRSSLTTAQHNHRAHNLLGALFSLDIRP